MRRIQFLIIILVLFPFIGFSGEKFYKVSDIPPALKEGSRSVIRLHSQEFVVTGVNSGLLKVTKVITVLNNNGINDAALIEEYDKYRKVSAIKGRVYDEYGDLIKKIAADEIHDFSAISGFSLYEDNRVKYVNPEVRHIPFTVEYSYEVEYKGLFYYPAYIPVPDYSIAIEKSLYKAVIQKGQTLRYLATHMPNEVNVSSDELSSIYVWEIENLKALKREPFSPSPVEFFPLVRFAPVEFEIGGVAGNSGSWLSLGDWFAHLNEGRDVLPELTVSRIRDLVSKTDNDIDKIRMVYEDMQSRVRYANIKIGMGGWQPIDATTVDRLSYGDCKALTNYMKALLKAAGIDSYYCLVSAGDKAPEIVEPFPSMQFNHVILCVPLNTDTIWLECTSQHLPCGFLGSFTANRKALLVDNNNSHLVNTIDYTLDDNVQTGFSQVVLDDGGGGNVKFSNKYYGLNYDEMISQYLADNTDKKKRISERMSFPEFNVLEFSYLETKSCQPKMEENINVDFDNYVTVFNSRYLLPLNCNSKITNSPPTLRNRLTPIDITNSFVEIDTIVYHLPENLMVESAPEPAEIVSEFGIYSTALQQSDGVMTYVRRLQINRGLYPPSAYADLIDFFDRVIIADDSKCILVNRP
jgi:transglutaminase-like putative cysteine protease